MEHLDSIRKEMIEEILSKIETNKLYYFYVCNTRKGLQYVIDKTIENIKNKLDEYSRNEIVVDVNKMAYRSNWAIKQQGITVSTYVKKKLKMLDKIVNKFSSIVSDGTFMTREELFENEIIEEDVLNSKLYKTIDTLNKVERFYYDILIHYLHEFEELKKLIDKEKFPTLTMVEEDVLLNQENIIIRAFKDNQYPKKWYNKKRIEKETREAEYNIRKYFNYIFDNELLSIKSQYSLIEKEKHEIIEKQNNNIADFYVSYDKIKTFTKTVKDILDIVPIEYACDYSDLLKSLRKKEATNFIEGYSVYKTNLEKEALFARWEREEEREKIKKEQELTKKIIDEYKKCNKLKENINDSLKKIAKEISELL